MQHQKTRTFQKAVSHRQKDFLVAHNNCVLCGEELHLRHIRTVDNLQIKEEAYCEKCDLRTRAKSYVLN